MSSTVQAFARQKIDISAFVDHVREVNKEAARIVDAPLGNGKDSDFHFHQELVGALDELEQTVKALRMVTIGAPSSSGQMQTPVAGKPVAQAIDKRDGVRGTWVLDTTENMISKGLLVAPVEFQQSMGWSTRQAVWKAAENHRVFYLTYKAERYFPAFYSDPAYERKHLEAVTKVLGDLPGGSKLQFFLTRKGSLGGDTPLQALAAGRVANVKDVAAAFAQAPMQA